MAIEDERTRTYFQLDSETDMQQGYFNEIIMITDECPWLLNPNRKSEWGNWGDDPRIEKMEQRVLGNMRQMRKYLERIKGNLEGREELKDLRPEDFITDKNRDRIARLDQIVDEFRQLGQVSTFIELDREKIRQLAYEATVLIYGEEHREDAKNRFDIQ